MAKPTAAQRAAAELAANAVRTTKDPIDADDAPLPQAVHGLRVWDSVRVTAQAHPQYDQVGYICAVNDADQSQVQVQFDQPSGPPIQVFILVRKLDKLGA